MTRHMVAANHNGDVALCKQYHNAQTTSNGNNSKHRVATCINNNAITRAAHGAVDAQAMCSVVAVAPAA